MPTGRPRDWLSGLRQIAVLVTCGIVLVVASAAVLARLKPDAYVYDMPAQRAGAAAEGLH